MIMRIQVRNIVKSVAKVLMELKVNIKLNNVVVQVRHDNYVIVS